MLGSWHTLLTQQVADAIDALPEEERQQVIAWLDAECPEPVPEAVLSLVARLQSAEGAGGVAPSGGHGQEERRGTQGEDSNFADSSEDCLREPSSRWLPP
jgi:hypothetical protein